MHECALLRLVKASHVKIENSAPCSVCCILPPGSLRGVGLGYINTKMYGADLEVRKWPTSTSGIGGPGRLDRIGTKGQGVMRGGHLIPQRERRNNPILTTNFITIGWRCQIINPDDHLTVRDSSDRHPSQPTRLSPTK